MLNKKTLRYLGQHIKQHGRLATIRLCRVGTEYKSGFYRGVKITPMPFEVAQTVVQDIQDARPWATA